ncbi:MAG TPA: cation diffusion facilitator family transporter [Gammaproteobacteria bacterium]|nr:cation diffusion facilitator family transporter [Gammaproteobacteria bacterium]
MDRVRTLRTTIIACALLNTLLGFFKLYVGYQSDAQTLMADGIHSFADLLTDIMVYVFARISEIPPDKNHPYGHRRFETLASFFFSILITSTALFIIYEAFIDQQHTLIIPWSNYAIVTALISIITNELMYWYVRKQSIKLSSPLLMANAVHQRVDAGTSVISLISIFASTLGYPYMDALGAVIIALMILRFAYNLLVDSLKELLDEGVNDATLHLYKQCILSTEGIINLHLLRTRTMSKRVYLDVHVEVSSMISVSEGHFIADNVESNLINSFDSISDVTVHVDVEDEEEFSYDQGTRLKIVTAINEVIPMDNQGIIIHYHKGKIHVNCHIESPLNPDKKQVIEAKLSALTKQFNSIKFWVSC